MGEALYDELARARGRRSAIARTPVRIYAPVGSHKELLAYLVRRLLENGANSSFVNRIADEQVSLDELVRDPVAELEALEAQAQPEDRASARPFRRRAPQQRRRRPVRPAGARAVARAAEGARKPQLDRQADARKGQGQGGHLAARPPDRRSARCSKRAPPRSTAWSAPAMPRSIGLGRARRRSARAAARPRRRPLRGASRGILLAVHSRGREDLDRRGARSARGGRFPALLRVRSAAPVHQAAAAAGPDRRAERAAPARPRGVRQHFAVEFPAGDLHRPDFGAAGRGQCRHRQAGRANAADRRARGRADAPGGHSQGRRPARARRRAGSSAER